MKMGGNHSNVEPSLNIRHLILDGEKYKSYLMYFKGALSKICGKLALYYLNEEDFHDF